MPTTPTPMPTPTAPPRRFSSYKLLSFDVYGTLIQYKASILHSFTPLLSRLPPSSPYRDSTPLLDSTHISNVASKGDVTFLRLFQKTEDAIKLELAEAPMRFDAVLREIWRRIARELDVQTSEEEAGVFGSEETVRSWRCFDGTVDALRRLSGAGFGLVAVSNVDGWATRISLAGSGLDGVEWMKVFVAEDFGTSKEELERADDVKIERVLEFAREKSMSREEVLHVAQSLGHDHAPCMRAGIASVFLVGDGPVWGKEEESRIAVERGLVGYGWRCRDLTEFADLVEKERND